MEDEATVAGGGEAAGVAVEVPTMMADVVAVVIVARTTMDHAVAAGAASAIEVVVEAEVEGADVAGAVHRPYTRKYKRHLE